MPTNYLQGVKPASDSVSDAYAKAAAIFSSATSGFRDREIEQYKLDTAAKQLEIENKRADAMLEMTKAREAREKETFDNEAINRQAVLDTTNTYNEVLSGKRLDSIAAANNKKAAMDYMTKNKIDPNSDLGWGSDKVQDIIKSNNEKERAKFLADPKRVKNVLETTQFADSIYDEKSKDFIGQNAIDVTKQQLLRTTMLDPVNKKVDRLNRIEDFITEADIKDKYDSRQEGRAFANNVKLAKLKAGLEAGSAKEDKSTDAQKMFNRMAHTVAAEKFDKLSTQEKKIYGNSDVYLMKHYPELTPAIYERIVDINKGYKTTAIDFSPFVSGKIGNATDVNNWINLRLKELAKPGNPKNFTRQDLYDSLRAAPQINNYFGDTADIDTAAATTMLQAIIDEKKNKR